MYRNVPMKPSPPVTKTCLPSRKPIATLHQICGARSNSAAKSVRAGLQITNSGLRRAPYVPSGAETWVHVSGHFGAAIQPSHGAQVGTPSSQANRNYQKNARFLLGEERSHPPLVRHTSSVNDYAPAYLACMPYACYTPEALISDLDTLSAGTLSSMIHVRGRTVAAVDVSTVFADTCIYTGLGAESSSELKTSKTPEHSSSGKSWNCFKELKGTANSIRAHATTSH